MQNGGGDFLDIIFWGGPKKLWIKSLWVLTIKDWLVFNQQSTLWVQKMILYDKFIFSLLRWLPITSFGRCVVCVVRNRNKTHYLRVNHNKRTQTKTFGCTRTSSTHRLFFGRTLRTQLAGKFWKSKNSIESIGLRCVEQHSMTKRTSENEQSEENQLNRREVFFLLVCCVAR